MGAFDFSEPGFNSAKKTQKKAPSTPRRCFTNSLHQCIIFGSTESMNLKGLWNISNSDRIVCDFCPISAEIGCTAHNNNS